MNQDTIAEPLVVTSTGRKDLEMNIEVDLADLSSVTLTRLVEEVRNEGLPGATKYDRTYNRHNR
jgi:hypothetical protein